LPTGGRVVAPGRSSRIGRSSFLQRRGIASNAAGSSCRGAPLAQVSVVGTGRRRPPAQPRSTRRGASCPWTVRRWAARRRSAGVRR
jgi:hypothetical protein